mmetsp:Transcript_44743/g.112793  ORF Transcript_44743/g.112793 Transcript_44743/m.112793 type:complete len:213 (+) Transcript_44743:364-1002(+)
MVPMPCGCCPSKALSPLYLPPLYLYSAYCVATGCGVRGFAVSLTSFSVTSGLLACSAAASACLWRPGEERRTSGEADLVPRCGVETIGVGTSAKWRVIPRDRSISARSRGEAIVLLGRGRRTVRFTRRFTRRLPGALSFSAVEMLLFASGVAVVVPGGLVDLGMWSCGRDRSTVLCDLERPCVRGTRRTRRPSLVMTTSPALASFSALFAGA